MYLQKKTTGLNVLLILLSFLLFCLFFDFFVNGFVLDGNHDRKEINVTYHFLNLRAIQDFSLAQWNPYIYCGTSQLGNDANLVFYPFVFIGYLLPEEFLDNYLTFLLIVHVFFAGVFSYLFIKRIVDDEFSSIVAALIYVFSSTSYMNMTVGAGCYLFLTYMPLWLFFIATFHERSLRKNFFYITAVLSLMFLGGMFQRVMYVIWLAFLYIIFNCVKKENNQLSFDWKPLLVNLGALSLAIGIASCRLMPFVYDTLNTGLIAPSSYEEYIAYGSMLPVGFFRFFMPEITGFILHYSPFYTMDRANHLETFAVYIGAIPGMLSLYFFFFIWDKKTVFWKFIVVLILLILLDTPVTYFQYLVSGKVQLIYPRIAWLLPISFLVIFSMNLKAFLESQEHLKRGIAFVLLLFLLVELFLLMFLNENINLIRLFAFQDITYYSQVYFFVLILLLVCLLSYASLFNSHILIVKYALIVLTLIDLLIVSTFDLNNSHRFLKPEPLYDYSENVQQFSKAFNEGEKNYRVLAMLDSVRYNQVLPIGLYNSGGADSNAPSRLTRLYTTIYDGLDRGKLSKTVPNTNELLHLTSSAKVIDESGNIMSHQYLPRASIFYQYEVVQDDKVLFNRILNEYTEEHPKLFLEKEPIFPAKQKQTFAVEKENVRIVEEENERIVIEVISKQKGLLFLTDNFHEGWNATVNGVESEIYRGNYTFRAIHVGAGKSVVEYRFEHPSLRISLAVSFISLFLFVFILVLLGQGRRNEEVISKS